MEHAESPLQHSSLPSSSIERTLGLLFLAQKQHATSPLATMQEDPEPTPVIAEPAVPEAGQRSLHSFWSIPSAAPSSTSSTPSVERSVYIMPTSCDECGSGFSTDNGDDAMEVDGSCGTGNYACGGCTRQICSNCSVSRIGEQRRCVNCTWSNAWEGAMGWAEARVTSC